MQLPGTQNCRKIYQIFDIITLINFFWSNFEKREIIFVAPMASLLQASPSAATARPDKLTTPAGQETPSADRLGTNGAAHSAVVLHEAQIRIREKDFPETSSTFSDLCC